LAKRAFGGHVAPEAAAVQERMMRIKNKIWVGIGAFVVAGTGAVGASGPASQPVNSANANVSGLPLAELLARTSIPQTPSHGIVVAQHAKHGGEGGENEGGEKGAGAKLPPDLSFALKIAQMRGHLLVGDQLVKEGEWAAALPHFLHPVEELYGGIRKQLREFKTPPFEAALKNLSNVVKRKKGGEDYDKALKTVNDALAAADAGLKEKEKNWPGFTMETALELLKSSTNEYEEAIVKGRIAKPVEYQDARGFVLQAETMIESVAGDLEKKDAEALKHVRDALAELKKTFPTAMPPKTPVKDHGAVLSDVSRIELAAGRLM
jgi:hypothetical protein